METHMGQGRTGWHRDSRAMNITFSAATLGTGQRKGVSRLHHIHPWWPPGWSLEEQSLLQERNLQEREHQGEEFTPVFRELHGLEKENRFTALHQCWQPHWSHQDYSQKQKIRQDLPILTSWSFFRAVLPTVVLQRKRCTNMFRTWPSALLFRKCASP